MTQRALAAAIEMDAAYLSRIENDLPNHLPNVQTIQRIIKALKINRPDSDYLFTYANKLPPDVMNKLLRNPILLEEIRRL